MKIILQHDKSINILTLHSKTKPKICNASKQRYYLTNRLSIADKQRTKKADAISPVNYSSNGSLLRYQRCHSPETNNTESSRYLLPFLAYFTAQSTLLCAWQYPGFDTQI
ncbi:hypothetical protein CDAR_233901 [Caerostris darwini]|uniref:Uncharacterized protein n=1 Tax=Caerostris darwini TaxID=1538125 RepID=A0AAV4QG97_9ARAC|nr:hypothetical protein CDAR_233901 [Caerostris darwini]